MGHSTKIEYVFKSWNPVTGCSKVSAGCEHCYAERMARRLHGMGNVRYKNGFDVTLHPDLLERPLKWRKPVSVFVCSMADLFHKDVPFEYLERIFDVIRRADRHVFLAYTKRSKALKRLNDRLSWPENLWMGVTVESSDYLYRIDALRSTNAKVKCLSLEPLIGPLGEIDLSGIDWVVVGGESGPGARPMQEEWVVDVLRQCREQGVAFYFKQWGGVNKKKTGRILGGRLYEEYPEVPASPSSPVQSSLF